MVKKKQAKNEKRKGNKKSLIKTLEPKNQFGEDIVIIEEKPYKKPTSIIFFIIVMCILILFLILSKNITFIVENFNFLTNPENLKFYLMLLIIPLFLIAKIYFDYKKSKKINLKL